jgi:nicotinamidase-related amidase
MYTLVVVDMQRTFKTTENLNVIRACQREIRLAIRRNYGIIFLEFDGCGETICELKDLISRYDKAYFTTKHGNDGSVEIAKLICGHNLYHNVRITGVNTSYCIYETVEGLKNYPGKITVVADACNCTSHPFGLKKLAGLKIKITNQCYDNKNKIDIPYPSW